MFLPDIRRPRAVLVSVQLPQISDEEQASAVYANVQPMTPDDIAECVVFALTRPPHVNVDELVVKALAQSSGGRILRDA